MTIDALLSYADLLGRRADRGPALLAGAPAGGVAAALATEAETAADRSETATATADASVATEGDALLVAAAADFTLAGDYLAHAEELDPDVLVDAAGRLHRRPIDPDLAEMAEAINQAARDERPVAGGASAPPPGPDADVVDRFQALVDQVLKAGGETITALVGAVGWSAVGGTVGAHVTAALDAAGPQWQAVVSSATGLLKSVRAAALRLFKAGLDKITKVLGSTVVDHLRSVLGDKVTAWIKDLKDAPGGLAGAILARVFSADGVAPACASTLTGKPAATFDAAVAAAKVPVDRAVSRASWLHKIVGLTSLFGPVLWTSPAAPYLAGGVALTIGAVAWQVQDCLDATEPFALPDLTAGLQHAARAAAA